MNEQPKTYQLTFNQEQVCVIQKALELYARIGIGQFDEIVNVLRMYDKRVDNRTAELEQPENLLRQAKTLCFGLPPNAYYSINAKDVPDSHKVAWDIMQVMRYQNWKDRPEHTPHTNDSSVHQTSEQPLPTMERK